MSEPRPNDQAYVDRNPMRPIDIQILCRWIAKAAVKTGQREMAEEYDRVVAKDEETIFNIKEAAEKDQSAMQLLRDKGVEFSHSQEVLWLDLHLLTHAIDQLELLRSYERDGYTLADIPKAEWVREEVVETEGFEPSSTPPAANSFSPGTA